jgi:hypothetical protein
VLEALGEFGECGADSVVGRDIGGEFVVPAAEVLHERVSDRDRLQGSHSFESAHWAQPGFESTMVGFDDVVGVLLQHVASARSEVLDDAWVDPC